jgi:drug/metabolite transporter (DMT)-like permease
VSAHTKAYLLLLFVTAIWGAAGPIGKYATDVFDPIIFLTYRFFLSSLVLVPLLFLIHPKSFHSLSSLPPKKLWLLLLSSLLGSTVQLLILFWGFSLTTSLDGTLIGTTSPLMTTIAGYWFLKEHITTQTKVGIGIAFLGSVVIILQPLLQSGALFSGSLTGNAIIFVSQIIWTIYLLLTKTELKEHFTPIFMTTLMFFVGFVSMSGIAILTHSPYQILSSLQSGPPIAHFSVFYMALLSGALAYFLYAQAQRTVSVSKANLFTYLSPFFAAPLAYFWLHEPITTYLVIGTIITSIGVFIAEYRPHSNLPA